MSEDQRAPIVIELHRAISMGDGFRFGWGFSSGVCGVFAVGLCVRAVLHWVGL